MANYHESDSEYSYYTEVIGEEKVEVGGDPEIHTDGEGNHMKNDFNGFGAKYVHTVVDKIFAQFHQSNLASTVLEKNLVGLDSRVDSIGMLLRMEPDDVQFIGICGMGGIGKTTLAWNVWKRFSSQYEGDCFLADVRRHDIIELQRTLLKKIVKGSEDHISNEYDGMAEIQRWLRRKKVLIVLDDVDSQLEQLYKLAQRGDWFGRDSRVIITTRDAGVLRSHGVDKKYIYQVDTLEKQEAIQQFRWHAFKQKAKIGVEELCGSVVHYCIGLPLVLEVVGCSLCGLEVAEWKNTLKKLKDTPNYAVFGTLKIIFDRLDLNTQKIFLHIAYFFRHEEEEYVKDVLKSCDLHPDIGMHVLIEKSLISVVEGRIEMHDLIQEMGWHIVRDEKHRSRVWRFKEVDDVLCGKMDPRHIECIVSPYTCGFRWQKDENISSAFEALKILIGKRSKNEEEEDNNFDRDVKDNYQLPSSLRWLHFPHYPFRSLPTTFRLSSLDTNLSELVGICLGNSYLENCWITKKLNKLTYLDLSYSYSLLETPDFNMMPNLRTLYLSHCSTLKEIHPSVGRLEKLVLLEVSNCYNLKKLPTFFQVSSLQFLELEACSSENFPEIQKSIPLVVDLNLKSIWIKELPPSIRQLCGLTKLRLFDCPNLVHLSNDLCELKNLKVLELTSCTELKSLPEKLGELSNLEELHIFDTAIFQLPSSITRLSSLECLCWGHKHGFGVRPLKFVSSVSGLCSLKRLQLCDFKSIDEGLPSDLGQCLMSLEYLNLQGSNFGYLPESFSQLPHLQYLDMRHCEKLKKLPELPKTISELYVDSHFAFGNESINIAMLAIKYPMLYSVSFSSCNYRNDAYKGKTFLAKESIQFPFQRNTPFSVSYSGYSFYGDNNKHYTLLKSFKYQNYRSNRISFDLNPSWYNPQFMGFAVYFVSSQADIWGPHSYQGFDDHTHHCVICKKKKKSSHNDIQNEHLQTECVKIAGSTCNNYDKGFDWETHDCFVYLPFSSLWPESKPMVEAMMEANDYSRFEVELVDSKASADWGINLLYKSPVGAREHMEYYHRSDSDEEEKKDGGSEHTENNGGYDAMAEDNNPGME